MYHIDLRAHGNLHYSCYSCYVYVCVHAIAATEQFFFYPFHKRTGSYVQMITLSAWANIMQSPVMAWVMSDSVSIFRGKSLKI